MISFFTAIAIAPILTTCISAAPLQARTSCHTGVQILMAGGSGCGEASWNACDLGNIAGQVVNAIPGSASQAIQYEASLDFSIYSQSLQTGIEPLQQAIRSYADACPEGKIVLMGYSQGAQVVSDALAGDGGDGSGAVALETKYHKHIYAVVTFADPSFNYAYGPSLSKGTGHGKGTSIRSQQSYQILDSFRGRYAIFCDEHDQYCSPTPPINYGTHESYFSPTHYINEATTFIRGTY